MRPIVILILAVLLGSCATTKAATETAVPSFLKGCEATDNYGEIDALELLNLHIKTTFTAQEYVGCAGGRSLVTVSWDGHMSDEKVSLARQVVGDFFRHFHPGSTISHDELAYLQTGDDTHTIVYEYTASINNSI